MNLRGRVIMRLPKRTTILTTPIYRLRAENWIVDVRSVTGGSWPQQAWYSLSEVTSGSGCKIVCHSVFAIGAGRTSGFLMHSHCSHMTSTV